MYLGEKRVKIFGEEISVNAKIEYIEGFSGHADQEGLLNFIYSFINKPKYIFLVHGEEEAINTLNKEIEKQTKIPTIIPSYGETYELNGKACLIAKIENKEKEQYLRLEILDKLESLKTELKNMQKIIEDEVYINTSKDKDMLSLNSNIKQLEEKITKIIN